MPRKFALALAIFVVPIAFAAEEENPYKKAKVGDYATYKMVTKIAGMNLEGTVTQTVAAKSDKEVTLKVTGNVNGMDIPSQEHKIDLTKPYDPLKSTLPADADAKIEKLKDGKEKIKAGGKEYETVWETYKLKFKANGMELDADVKVWQSKAVQLQMVKMEMTAEVAGMKVEVEMELSETGKKSD